MLRKSGAAMDGLTITRQLMDERELNVSDKKLVTTIQKRVGAALRNMRERGLVTSDEPRRGGLLAWQVAQR